MTTKGKSFDGTEAYPRFEIFDLLPAEAIFRQGNIYLPECCAIELVRITAKQGLTRA
jgi:hypothetical protein